MYSHEKTSLSFFTTLQNLDIFLRNIKVFIKQEKTQRVFFQGCVSFFQLQRNPINQEKTCPGPEKNSKSFFTMLQNLDVFLRKHQGFASRKKIKRVFLRGRVNFFQLQRGPIN
jgi:hypothetical protein